MSPRICVLRTDGTNCDRETKAAIDLAGGDGVIVHVNQLRSGSHSLGEFQGLVIPGGFSYGDDIQSGKVLATELMTHLGDQMKSLVAAKKPVLGICNGFQVLVRTGLLPYPERGEMHATLAHNTSGHFQCQWVSLEVSDGPCQFTHGLADDVIELQMAHGEGRFFADDVLLDRMVQDKLVAMRYVDTPNGSMRRIAGVCDPSGRIFGLMPHPERYVRLDQHYSWRNAPHPEPHGLGIFQNLVAMADGQL